MTAEKDYFNNEEIDERHPARIGSQVLPVLPVESISLNGSLADIAPNAQKNVDTIVRIAGECGVHYIAFYVEYRLREGTPLDGQYPTVVIVSNMEKDGARDAWVLAARKVRAESIKQEFRIPLEIIDLTVFRDKTISLPILSYEGELMQKFQSCLSEIVNKLKGHAWKTMDLLHRGYREHSCRPTLTIGAKDADDKQWWNDTLPSLRALLSPEIEVELWFVDHILATNKKKKRDQPENYLLPGGPYATMSNYSGPVSMGDSCGVNGKDWSGTIGGMITLSNGPETTTCILTNDHVLWDNDRFRNDTNQAPYDLIAANSHEGCNSQHSWLSPEHGLATKESQWVVSPSDQDHRDMIARKDQTIEECRQVLSKLPESQESRRRPHTRDLKAAREEKQTAEAFNRKIGSIFASSRRWVQRHGGYQDTSIRHWKVPDWKDAGRPITENPMKWILDWGLVKLATGKEFALDLLGTTGNVRLSRGNHLERYYTIDPFTNYDVAKLGRTSGWTVGTISAFPSIVNMATVAADSMDDAYQEIALCHTIVNDRNETRMIGAGDSGCLVLLNHETTDEGLGEAPIVGLGFASMDYQLVSYMMPFDLVIEDIERVTGMTVEFPYRGGRYDLPSDYSSD